MTIIISSVLMLVLFGGIVVVERRHARRSKEFIERSETMIADLAGRAEERYRAKYGRDPTGKIQTLAFRRKSSP